jgi:hypothetical protein
VRQLSDLLLRVALAIPLAYEGIRMLWIALRFYVPAGVSPWLLVFAAFLGAAVVLLLASVLLVVRRHGRWLWLAVIVWAVAFGAFEVYAWATLGYFAWVPVTEELVFVVYATVLSIAFLVTPFSARVPSSDSG